MAPAMSKMSKLRVLAATAAVMASTNCTEFQPRPAPVAVDAVKLTTTTLSTDKDSSSSDAPVASDAPWWRRMLSFGGPMRENNEKRAKWEADKRREAEQKAEAEKTAAELEAQAEKIKTDAVIQQVTGEMVSRVFENVLDAAAAREAKAKAEAEEGIKGGRSGAIEALMHGRPGAQEAYRVAKEAKLVDSQDDFFEKVSITGELKIDELLQLSEENADDDEIVTPDNDDDDADAKAEQKRLTEAYEFALETKQVETFTDFMRKIGEKELSVAKLLQEKKEAAEKKPVPPTPTPGTGFSLSMTLCGKVMLWIFGTVVFMLAILFGRVLCSRKSDEGESESEMEESDSEAEDEARSRAESMSP